ncbi:MAG: MBL fold metallo-hydrolase [Ichthyobacteriaceae bacterium]|nr:MBL fold metallo-hydrolase [Ichthyobacteriaceae bacterium]
MNYPDYKIHHLNGYIQAIYIVEYNNKLLMLDGASRADAKKIEYFITRTLKRSMTDLKLIVVSHMHPDHAGAAPILRKKYGISIAAHHEIELWYNGFWGHIQHLLDVVFTWYVASKTRNKKKYKRVWYHRSLIPDFKMHDGDSLPFFNDWQVVYNPGHTTHDISVYHNKNKVIYVGDLALKLGSKFALPFPVALLHKMEESLNKVNELDVETVLFAHGGVETERAKEVFTAVKKQLKHYPPKMFKFMKSFNSLNCAIKKHQVKKD